MDSFFSFHGVVMFRPVLLSLLAVTALGFSLPAQAQADLGDKAKRLELAQKMHEIRPARAQVDEAVQQVARNLPPLEREKLLNLVEKAFDYKKLEKLSVDTMVDLFTVAELQKMVDYFGSPEAKAIGEKLPQYQAKLQPEILRMLDTALMEDRTGGPPDKIETLTGPEKTDGQRPQAAKPDQP